VANLRVLLNKENIRHVIKDGEVQVFPETWTASGSSLTGCPPCTPRLT
jgi:hypothetical protein